MKTKSPTPKQWHTFRRLQRAGCPLDLEHLPPPDHPFRVVDLSAHVTRNVYQLPASVGIAIYVRIVASAPTMVAGYGLEADWLAAPVKWLRGCQSHRGDHCLEAADGHHRFEKVLNQRVLWGGRLKSNEFMQGWLVGTTAAPLRTNDEELPATLWIHDVAGTEYPYALRLHNPG